MRGSARTLLRSLVCCALLLMAGSSSALLARDCYDDTAPIDFTLSGTIGGIEGAPGMYYVGQCTLKVAKGQHFLIAEYWETWCDYGPPGQETLTFELTGPGGILLDREVYTADRSNPPSGMNRGEYGWRRLVYKKIDVSSLTLAGDATLLMTMTDSRTAFGYPAMASVNLFRFTLTQTPKSFRPRDSRDPAADCDHYPTDCHPSYTASFGDSYLWYPIRFSLSLPTGKQNLTGTSTNFGSDKASDPDYVFDLDQNPGFTLVGGSNQAIQTSEDVDSATAVVSSHDFGGVANLTATAILQGDTSVEVQAEIIASDGSAQPPPIVQSPTCAGDGLFASLPIDQDCNGIADSWEEQYAGPGGHLDPKADDEPGAQGDATPADHKGDGFSVFDEYRGFHVLASNGSPTWTDTDPKKQDLFYWDASNFIEDANYGNHLGNVFGKETGSFIVLHRVNAEQAHGDDTAPTKRTRPLNSSNPFPSPRGFAITYVVDKPDKNRPGILGEAGKDEDAEEAFRNGGDRPVRIILDTIKAKAKDLRQTGANDYASVLLGQVLAHETGHKLGRQHPERTAEKTPYIDTDLGKKNLPFGYFMQDPDHLGRFWMRLTVYKLTTQAGFKENRTIETDEYVLRCGNYDASGTFWQHYRCPAGATSYGGAAQPPNWTFRLTSSDEATTMPVDVVILDWQDGKIMAYTPQLDRVSDAEWTFRSEDLNGLCLLAAGCDPQPR